MGALRFDLTRALKWSLAITGLYVVAEVVFLLHTSWLLAFFGRVESGNFSQAELLAEGARIDGFGVFVAVGSIGIGILAFIINGIWIYRASWNARELQPDPARITPGWSVGWYAVPFALLWKPFQAMRQTWNSSEDPTLDIDRPAPGLLGWWWATWIVSSILSNISFRIYMAADNIDAGRAAAWIDVVTFFIAVPAALLFMAVMRGVTAMQLGHSEEATP